MLCLNICNVIAVILVGTVEIEPLDTTITLGLVVCSIIMIVLYRKLPCAHNISFYIYIPDIFREQGEYLTFTEQCSFSMTNRSKKVSLVVTFHADIRKHEINCSSLFNII